jgi:hypothetical protein
MAEKEMKKCAHPSCACQTTEKYCSTFCETAGKDDLEVGCDCGHPACET